MTRRPPPKGKEYALLIAGVILFVGVGGLYLQIQREGGRPFVPRDGRRLPTPAKEDPVSDSMEERRLDSVQKNKPDLRSAWDGVYMEEQATRGEIVYENECAQCHLDNLRGGGVAPALVGSSVIEQWKDRSVGSLYAIIRSTMPVGAPASLTRQDYIDVVAFLLKVNEYPAGDERLTLNREELDRIELGTN